MKKGAGVFGETAGMKRLALMVGILGFGFCVVGCGGGGEGGGEGSGCSATPAPAEYADKHMPAGWWTDPKVLEEGRSCTSAEES